MRAVFRFTDWPLRAKMAALLVAASALPLAISAIIDIREARRTAIESATALLTARGDQLRDEIDTFNQGYLRSAVKLSRLPAVVEVFRGGGEDVESLESTARIALDVQPASDADVRGAAVLDLSGKVRVATEESMTNADLSFHKYVRDALQGAPVISGIHLAESQVGYAPTIAYVAPIETSDGKLTGLAVVWVRATALWDLTTESNELAGRGSFAVLCDEQGIRIAHSYNDDFVFHPGDPLDAAIVDSLVAEGRFGERTRELLEDVRSFPEQFARARSASLDGKVFYEFSPVNQRWNYGVARRFATVPWTVFYMIPEESLLAAITTMTQQKILFTAVIIVFALLAGMVFALFVLWPARALTKAAESFGKGDLSVRVSTGRRDELGVLGSAFNSMAERIEVQARGLQRARDELEVRVAELAKTAGELRDEIAERELAQRKLSAQLERMNLLHQITRATGERQDLQSIFQVVIRSLEEHLAIDFVCVCLYDDAASVLTVTSVGVGSGALAMELALTEQSRIDIDANGLSRCVHGKLVYEPDVSQVAYPFPQRLAAAGLRALVAAPLLVESKVFGALLVASQTPQRFSSGECEFLRQLSEHVALAAHQAQLYGALQQAYDELRQTQQSVMQQERLRALGQMASGIAHDINNAISPAAMYTESLLENEPNLSTRARDYLETIARAIDDVAATVARMREFYRQREPQLKLAPVRLNLLVQQVVDLTRARWNDIPQQRGIVIQLVTDLSPDIPPIMGAENEIREALTNLVFNAVDSMSEGGTLTLRTSVVETAPDDEGDPVVRRVQIEISDTGAGMDEDTRRRCLEPFFTTKGERGTGLGLAMVYGVVQRHSADIEIDSAVGEGTTVRLTFAVPTADLSAPGRAEPYKQVPSPQRILVVDDDPVLLKSLLNTLEMDRHSVVTANGGQAGIDSFRDALKRNEPFSVVITDLGMPYVDGRKVAAALKAESPVTPVILLTGWGERLVAEGDVPIHVDRVLSKPPKLRDIREALIQCCVQPE